MVCAAVHVHGGHRDEVIVELGVGQAVGPEAANHDGELEVAREHCNRGRH